MCSIEANTPVMEGDAIHVGDYSFRVIHTPGHAPGHISLYESSKRILLAADLIGEIVAWYTPSSGGAEGYLDSLKKIDDLDVDLILPSHGEIITDTRKAIKETREKILERDNVINNALRTGPKTFEELNRVLFDKPNIQFFPGTPILESHLQKLKKERKIRREGTGSDRFCIL
jgi:glyoxylase-like metal-dependent hydrolase (beta-lactamase superfamily II)